MPDCLFILPSFRVGGAEKVVIRIANALAAMDLKVALTAIDGVGELRRDIAPGIPVHDLGVRKTRYAALSLIVLIRKQRPSVVFSSLTRVSLLLLLVRPLLPASTRIVVRQPSIASIEMRDLHPSWLYRLLFPRLIPKADAIITQSKVMTADLKMLPGIRSDQVTMINNPVPEIDRHSYYMKRSPFDSEINFLAVGRLSHEKGPDVLLRSFAEVVTRVPSAALTLLGDGPLRAEMQELACELGIYDRVRFLGYVADPFPYYVHADAVVLASHREGFPNVLLEAIACGTPVVATDCGGVSAEIVSDGENGYVVPGNDFEQLSDAMVRVLTLRRERPPSSIAATAVRFDPAAVYAAYGCVIRNLVANHLQHGESKVR